MLVEWGLADFGNPDLVVVAYTPTGPHCIFIEAKVGPYLTSMMPNRVGMRRAGFNSSINGQLALKYRFANALAKMTSADGSIEEPTELARQYRLQLADPRSMPRRLVQPKIVRMFREYGLAGIPESRCSYVALTWDSEERPYYHDPFVAREDGLPAFRNDVGKDVFDAVRPRLGWLGFQHLQADLGLDQVAEYRAVFAIMFPNLIPDAQAYAAAESGFLGDEISAESLTQAAQFRELFPAHKVVATKGSFSVLENGETIAKIIPRRDSVFVGIRDTKSPHLWFSGHLDRVVKYQDSSYAPPLAK